MQWSRHFSLLLALFALNFDARSMLDLKPPFLVHRAGVSETGILQLLQGWGPGGGGGDSHMKETGMLVVSLRV